uniref:Uncharacterized protein n=1 Tax=Glossina pallidipes TaxID=7398 RepID=A0A1B0AET9_GLOPL
MRRDENIHGLCPGNRLRILNSYDSGCFSPSPASSPCPSLAASTATLNSSICSADIYENTSIISSPGSTTNGSANGSISASQTHLNTTTAGNAVTANNLQQQQQRQGIRRSWHVSPNKRNHISFFNLQSYISEYKFVTPLD